MVIAGIVGHQGILQTANLINSILSSTGKKVSVSDSKVLTGLDAKRVKNYLNELEKNNTDILVIKLDPDDVNSQAMEYVQFDIMVYTGKTEGMNIFSRMAEKGVAIINMDEGDVLSFLEGAVNPVVTYGFNSKASITASSVGDSVFGDGFICCLQKTISAKNGDVIGPQEYRLNIEADEIDRHSILAAATFAIINGIDLNTVGDGETGNYPKNI